MSEPKRIRSRGLTTLTLLLSGMMVFSIHMPARSPDNSKTSAASVPAESAAILPSHLAGQTDVTAGSGPADTLVMQADDTAGSADIAIGITSPSSIAGGAASLASATPSAPPMTAAPAIRSPLPETTIDIDDRTFSWDASPNADRYHVILTDTIRWRRVYDRVDIRRARITLPPGILYHGGAFSLSVQAYSGTGASEPSRVDFSVRGLPLPAITAPENGASLDLADVSIVWEPVPGISQYHVVVKDTVSWKTVLDRKHLRETRCLLEASRLAIGGQYRLYVHPTADGQDGAPAHVDIHTQRLSSPRLITPAPGAVVGLEDVTVAWDPVLMATSYHVALTRPDSGEVVLEKRGIEGSSFTLDAALLQPGTACRVFVFACVGVNESAPVYGDFTVEPLEAPVLTQPAAGATLPVEQFGIAWNPVPGADHYKLVMTDTLSWQPVLQIENLTEPACFVEAAHLSRGGQYRIYVHAVRGVVESAPGMADVSMEPLSQPRMTAPLNAAELPVGDVDVAWHAVPGAEQYRVTLTDTVTWEVRSTQAGVTDTVYRFDASLFTPGGTYRIYVSAMAGSGESTPAITDIRMGR